ncbi:MAG TPA: TIGR03936 family radical SAM-associated protein [Syntrophomonadaceae bacterium]|nr:TIGR03936 family radical SAM-associated protein [Syntrophomonadaceae bacterium]
MFFRAEYRVGPELKFLGNLDTMHLMERALRRAALPYALSEGFNPHIKLSMGTVLPVGLWSEKEYFDLEINGEMETAEFLGKLNPVLPPDLQVINCIEIPAGMPSLMKSINAACYMFIGHEPDQSWLDQIWASSSLPVKSRGKKKDVVKDLRPGLFRLELEKMDNKICAWVSAGEPLNIRYDELLDLFESRGLTRSKFKDVYRHGNYIKKGNDFYSPIEAGLVY